jgi:predicted dehydrogenase
MFNSILFFGLGGAGQRHLRIFRELLPDAQFFAYRHTKKTPLLNTDFSVDENGTIEKDYNVKLFDNVNKAFLVAKPELTVISTPTSKHRDFMMLAVEAGSSVFVEKPWAESLDRFDEFKNIIKEKELQFHVSFQRRFHPLIYKTYQTISKGVIGNVMAASFTVISNVPFWHPYEDWKNLYAVRSELGGGVLLTEIHEIDLVCWLFGLPNSVFCTGGNRSAEDISVEDTVQMLLLYSDFSVEITLCFMHQNTNREYSILGQKGKISWSEKDDLLTVSSYGAADEIISGDNFSMNDMFKHQANKFINDWSYEDTEKSLLSASSSLAIVRAARQSMASGRKEEMNYERG